MALITPDEIVQKLRQRYGEFLRATLSGEPFFPLDLPFGKPAASLDYLTLRHWVETLVNGSREVIGYGYTVTLRPQNTRRYGQQSLPARISVETEADYLRLLRKQREVEQVRQRYAETARRLPTLLPWLPDHAKVLVDNLADWSELLTVCAYFVDHPRPQLYLRELPIALHTKFIEQHQAPLRSLLDQLLPASAVRQEANRFEERYYLRHEQPLVRLRLLDNALRQQLAWPATDLCLPLDQAAVLPLADLRVIVVENKMNFLAFPAVDRALAIWGAGYHARTLAALPWLAQCELWYWGDLDVDGFQILAAVRSHLPHTRSLCMDQATWEAFAAFAVPDPNRPARDPNQLTAAEAILHQQIAARQLRLEQEHVSQAWLLSELGKRGLGADAGVGTGW